MQGKGWRVIDWLEKPERRIPHAAQLQLAEAALARRPGAPRLLAQIGVIRERLGRPREALTALDASLRADPDGFTEWAELARVHARLGDGDAAFAACERGMERRPDGSLARTRGILLEGRGRRGEALHAYQQAVSLPGRDLAALERLFPLLLADHADAALDYCDQLDPAHRNTAITRAWRAVALSQSGRRDDAMAILNPAEHMLRIPFEPPLEFGGVEAFNTLLADEIATDPSGRVIRNNFHLNVTPRQTGRPALQAVQAFIRASLEAAAADPARYGLEGEPRPAAASLDAITSVLVGDASNRQHVHQGAYLTAIYHVRVPEAVRQSEGRAGALELGGCDQMLPGFDSCWERVYLKPREGWLTIIPSHMFHDVVPTGTMEPRVSTAADLTPADA